MATRTRNQEAIALNWEENESLCWGHANCLLSIPMCLYSRDIILHMRIYSLKFYSQFAFKCYNFFNLLQICKIRFVWRWCIFFSDRLLIILYFFKGVSSNFWGRWAAKYLNNWCKIRFLGHHQFSYPHCLNEAAFTDEFNSRSQPFVSPMNNLSRKI